MANAHLISTTTVGTSVKRVLYSGPLTAKFWMFLCAEPHGYTSACAPFRALVLYTSFHISQLFPPFSFVYTHTTHCAVDCDIGIHMNFYTADSLGAAAAAGAMSAGPQVGGQFDNNSILTEETDPRTIPIHELDCFKDGSMLADLQNGAPAIYSGLVLQHQAQQQHLLQQHIQQQQSFHRQQQVIASEQARLIENANAMMATTLPMQMATVPPLGVAPALNVSPAPTIPTIPAAAIAPPAQDTTPGGRSKLRRTAPMNAQQLTAVALAVAAANGGTPVGGGVNGQSNGAVPTGPSVASPVPVSNKRAASGPAQTDVEKREERKLLRAARNRQSATSSRERKKRHLKELHRRFDLFTRENARLKASEVEFVRSRLERESALAQENQHLKVKIQNRKTNIADISHAIGRGDECPFTPSVPTTPADGGMNIMPPSNAIAAAAAAVAQKALPPVPEKTGTHKEQT